MFQHEILRHFKGVQGRGNRYRALCPAHDDHNPSLSITFEGDKVLLHCFAGCPYGSIMAAAGLETKNTEAWELIAEYQYSPTLKKVRYRLPDGTKRFVWKHKKG